MIRYKAAAVLLALAVAVSLCGCGSREGEQGSEPSAQSAAEQLAAASELMDKLTQSGLCPELDERADIGSDEFATACDKLYGESADKFSDGGIMFVSSGATADELSVLKSDSADCAELLEQRRQRRYKDFEGYAPAELDKIEKARIFTAGGLTVMVISDKAEEVERLLGRE